jgi:hypothetical protein
MSHFGVGSTEGTSGNSRRETAAVMRYGCWRGTFFEGYTRREDAHVAGRDLRITGSDAHRNAANPTSGSGMQQAREPDAE